MQKTTPCLWFNGRAGEAARFYTAVFKEAQMGEVVRYGPGGPVPEDAVLTATFTLFGQEYVALNGGPQFHFNPSVSFIINCDTQEEIDRYWDALCEGGQASQCGWLQDKFGLSWQVVPRKLGEWMTDKDTARRQRVMQALMGMQKLHLPALQEAYDEDA